MSTFMTSVKPRFNFCILHGLTEETRFNKQRFEKIFATRKRIKWKIG